MNYNVNKDFLKQLSSDLNKKYLSSGIVLGGSIDDNKIKLYPEDIHGKHSNFAVRIFYGKINGNILSGRFSVSRLVILLLGILAVVCIESIIAAAIFSSLESMIFPIFILIVEALYFIFIKRISHDNEELINKYLEDCTVED